MSNWLSEFSGEEQRQVDELNRQGITGKPTQKKEVGLFDGAASSPFRGAGAGFAKVADTIAAPIDAVFDTGRYGIDYALNLGNIVPFEDYISKERKSRDDLVYGSIDYLEDKENTGTIGNIGFSLGDYATRAVIGSAVGGVPGAIAATGLSETDYVYGDLTRQGVDEATAAKVAITDGAVAAVSTALPMSYGFKGTGGIIKDGLLSVGGATALSQGGQAVSGAILDSEGYDKQAKKYEVNAESVTTDVLLNTLFFGAARGASRYLNADATPEQIEARTTQQQAALVLNEAEFDDVAIPVTPSNPIQHNNHLVNMREATESMKAGRPVKINRNVEGEEKQKPINYSTMAIPTNAKTIAHKAQQAGINPSVALTISHIETGGTFDHTIRPPKGKDGKHISSAHGLFQVLDKTWKQQGGGDRNNIDEQIRMGFKHMQNAEKYIKKQIGRDLQPHEHYLGHLLGPAGAVNVLKADPNTPLIDIVRKYDPKNANDIVKNNGMSGLTAGQAIQKWQQKWNTLSARYGGGGTSTVMGLDGSSYDVAFEVKSLGELIASNDLAYGVNPLYPADLQPRDRTREASRQQIENMASDLRPEWLGESPKLSDGAPIVGMDNVVESGNGRTLAIGKAYESGRADAYQQFVTDFAASRGMDISGIDRPVLVRTRLTDTDRVQFTQLANQADVAQFSATERAKTDADRLPDTSLIKLNADGNINLEQSMDFVRSFVSQLPKSEQASVITGDGRLSQDGKRRIESAIAQRAYNDSGLIARLSENLDDDSKTVLNALLRAAPQLAQLNDLVKQGGRHSNTLADDLAQAAQKLSDLKANGQTVPDYLNQGQLLEDGLSDGAKAFLNVFDSNKRSAKAIGENIQGKIDEVEAMGDPRQGSLFGGSPEEQEALKLAFENPNQSISVSREGANGEPEVITMTLKDYINELNNDAKAVQEQGVAAEAAALCFLSHGA